MTMPKYRRRMLGWLIALGCLATAIAADDAPVPSKLQASMEDRNRLWMLIHDVCVPAASRQAYPPTPCTEVDTDSGYAVLKDRAGQYQYLVLPLARIAGIESPSLLASDAPNYFADAWTARLYVQAALHAEQPRDVLIMVVNSASGRSQDQLHIHINCVRPDVHDALQRLLPTINGQWHPLIEPLPPHQHTYQAMWVEGTTLSINPFKTLANALPPGDRMASHSLIVMGGYSTTGNPGFILLSSHVDPAHGDHGNGDELTDMDCLMARR